MVKLIFVLALAVVCFSQGCYKRPRDISLKQVGEPLQMQPLEALPTELLWHNNTGVDFLTVSKN